jgi:tryptophan-rich sensory protein
MKPNYYLIPIITIFTASVGGWLLAYGIEWYDLLTLPAWAPNGIVLSLVWTILYACATLAALMVWNVMPRDTVFATAIGLLAFNVTLNMLWPAAFFWLQEFGPSLWMAVFLLLTTLGLVGVLWNYVRAAALLLLPYAVWVAYASYLTYVIWKLN